MTVNDEARPFFVRHHVLFPSCVKLSCLSDEGLNGKLV